MGGGVLYMKQGRVGEGRFSVRGKCKGREGRSIERGGKEGTQ